MVTFGGGQTSRVVRCFFLGRLLAESPTRSADRAHFDLVFSAGVRDMERVLVAGPPKQILLSSLIEV